MINPESDPVELESKHSSPNIHSHHNSVLGNGIKRIRRWSDFSIAVARVIFFHKCFWKLQNKGDRNHKYLNSPHSMSEKFRKQSIQNSKQHFQLLALADIKVKLLVSRKSCGCMLSHVLIFRRYEHGSHSSDLICYFSILK